MRELVARVNALVRRVDRARALAQTPDDAAPLDLGPVAIDRAERRVRRDGTEVHLTPTEFDLLVRLASSPRTVDSHVKALRRKLGPGLIRTVHGVGYSAEPTGDAQDDAHDEADDEAEDRP
jgi:DNA-binding response OmpR family regulator